LRVELLQRIRACCSKRGRETKLWRKGEVDWRKGEVDWRKGEVERRGEKRGEGLQWQG
jgi:hypothetical protein